MLRICALIAFSLYSFVFTGALASAPAMPSSMAVASFPDYVKVYTVSGRTKNGMRFFLLPRHAGYMPQLYELWSDPDIVRYNARFRSRPSRWTFIREEKALDFAWKKFYDMRSQPRLPDLPLRYTVVDENGEFLGEAGISKSATKRNTIYYNLKRSARGKGIGTAVAIRLVEVFKGFWPDEELYIQLRPDNAASRRVAEKLNFKQLMDAKGAPQLDFLQGREYWVYKMPKVANKDMPKAGACR